MDSRQNLTGSKFLNAGIDSLSVAIKAAQDKKISEARDFFEQLLVDFPTCGRFWKIYIEQELKARNFERVEKLFQRSLIKVLNIDLWKCYLNYVRDTKVKMSNYKEKTAQAYDFALDKIGLDVMSYSIWVDYVNFLKSVEASGSFAENQKITAIRKVYQKGVMNPMVNIEQLWKDYCVFENLINPLIAKRMIDDRSKEFMTVRKIAKEYENVTRNLDRNSPSFPPQGSQDEMKQKHLWKKYIQWEKSNPLKSEDNALVAKRVLFAMEQSLLAMSTHVDVSLEAVLYLQQQAAIMAEKCEITMSKFYTEEALQMYERLIKGSMSNNMLVYFAYADYEESRLNYQKVSQIYDKFLEKKDIDPSLCYIQYMRFLRRAEGIRSARTVFKRAREDPRITYHVFVAAGLIEYFCTKDKNIANKIFQLGCKNFGAIPEYVQAYDEFLRHMNEDDIIRGLYENILVNGQLPVDKTGDLWLNWLEFENTAGTTEQILHAEQKRNEKYSKAEYEERQTTLLIERYRFMNMYPVDALELKALGYKDSNNNAANTAGVLLSLPGQEIPFGTLTEAQQILGEENLKLLTESTKSKSVFPDTDAINPYSKLASRNLPGPHPDVSKMLPFKSNKNTFGGVQPVPGGGMFLFPSIIADMIKRLPPPGNFNGPFVMIDEFLNNFKTIDLEEDYQSFYTKCESRLNKTESSSSPTKMDTDEHQDVKTEGNSVKQSLSPKNGQNVPTNGQSVKRAHTPQQDDAGGEDEENQGPEQAAQKQTHQKKSLKFS